MSRSRFTRLGDHIARDKAAEVRAKAAAGDAAAIDDLSRLNGILTPDGLDDKLQDVVSQMLARAAHTLKGEGCEAPPLSGFSSAEQHGWMLLTWAKKQSFDCDSLPGRMVTVIGLCAQTLIEMDRGDARFREEERLERRLSTSGTSLPFEDMKPIRERAYRLAQWLRRFASRAVRM
jgi:hypothetical protein